MFPVTAPPPLTMSPPPALVHILRETPKPGARGRKWKGLRLQAQQEAAFTLGVQAGAAWRYEKIDQLLNTQSNTLDKLYDFKPFMLDHDRVMPPVVVRSGALFQVEDSSHATSAQASFRIVSPARIVTIAPSWRDYLVKHFQVLEQPNPALLPKNRKERRNWVAGVMDGWRVGVAQADEIFKEGLGALTRDLTGIARFRWLGKEGVVSLPYLATGNMGIRISAKTLTIGGRIYRITAPAQWREKGWKAQGAILLNPPGS